MEFKFIRNGLLGFYSDAFRMLTNYMICKKYSIPFYLDSKEWTFAHEKGWHDYFTSLQESQSPGNIPEIKYEKSDDKSFTVADYKQAMKEVFVYKPYLHELASKVHTDLGLGDAYTAVFIRRGDKLIGESVYIPTEAYVHLILKANLDTVFVQTDDYRCVEELRTLLHKTRPTMRIVSTCPPTKHGHFACPSESVEVRLTEYAGPNGTKVVYRQNVEYLEKTTKQKSLMEFTKEEVKAHVEEMLVGMILCQKSTFLVLDNTSNVGRYLHFTHPGGRQALLHVEDLAIFVLPNVRLLPIVSYKDEEYITNPRYHCVHNGYK